MILINFMLIYLNLCSTKGVFRVELYDLGTSFSHFQNKFIIKVNFSSFLANFQFRAEVKKVTSRAEPSRAEPSQAENPSARAMARASSARTHH